MKIAICNETYTDWDWADVCQHASSVGYDGLEIAPFTLGERPVTLPRARRRELRSVAADHGLQIVGLHWLLAGTTGLHLTSPDRHVRQRTADHLTGLCELCADLGGHVMVFGSPQQRNRLAGVAPQTAMNWATEVFSAVVPELESRGVTLALEPLGPEEGNFLNTAREAIELCESIGSENVRLHLDVKAMSTESHPIDQIIRDSAPWLAHFHANDPNRQGPGMGSVDFRPIISALRSIDYDGWISVEVFDLSPGVEPLTRRSIEYLRAIMDAE